MFNRALHLVARDEPRLNKISHEWGSSTFIRCQGSSTFLRCQHCDKVSQQHRSDETFSFLSFKWEEPTFWWNEEKVRTASKWSFWDFSSFKLDRKKLCNYFCHNFQLHVFFFCHDPCQTKSSGSDLLNFCIFLIESNHWLSRV